MDWTMSSPNTRFAEVMGVIAQVLQQNSASAFEYEDEDGDRITVRGDPEMVAMMDFVNTRPAGAVARGADSGISLQYAKHEAELREILSRGRIAEADINKTEVLGRGQSGSVWKNRVVSRRQVPDNPANTSFNLILEKIISVSTDNCLLSTPNHLPCFGEILNLPQKPERVLGHKYGVHSEVWSVGLFLLEMATGRFPYPVANHGHDLAPLHILQCIVHEVPPRLSVEKFTREFSDFVACCMEKEHSKRPSPELVLLHPFIRMYDDNDKQMIGCWVYTQLQAKEGGGAGAT
ncbi:putative dual specificity mitogen-activated protein kinase kinase 5 [Apostichopus japonicus]|uniref:mitogen-activated protein kinase kinase n=1 Tax=Stichopus japonicus TaxID=307972 RepID=A0A2G8L730_STIJA|nr:putative dual specificity mitogen-activated protein kinase kinase 5 [Apostichopus japonicus]